MSPSQRSNRARGSKRAATFVLAGVILVALAGGSAGALGIDGPGAGTAGASTWTVQRTPSTGASHGDLTGVACASVSWCVAVGYTFGTDPGTTRPLIERYRGPGGWSVETIKLGRKQHGQLQGVTCRSSRFCFAVGTLETAGGDTLPLLERWNGAGWHRERAPRAHFEGSVDETGLNAVTCTSTRACVAVGLDEDSGYPLVERFNGRRWGVQRSQTPNEDGGVLLAVACTSRRDCTTVGRSADAGVAGCSAPIIERSRGGRWTLQRVPRLPACSGVNGSGLNAISCAVASACIAVGQFDRDNQAHDQALVERRRAGGWSIGPVPTATHLIDPWGGGVYLNGIACSSRRACEAVGSAGSELRLVPIAERWNGRRWRLERTAPKLRDGELFDIACPVRHQCIAVGANYGLRSGADEPLAERLER